MKTGRLASTTVLVLVALLWLGPYAWMTLTSFKTLPEIVESGDWTIPSLSEQIKPKLIEQVDTVLAKVAEARPAVVQFLLRVSWSRKIGPRGHTNRCYRSACQTALLPLLTQRGSDLLGHRNGVPGAVVDPHSPVGVACHEQPGQRT